MKTTHDLKIIIRCLALSMGLSTALGFASTTSAQQHSYIVDLNSKKVTDLGSASAVAINDAGQVVGWPFTGTNHAFITGPNGVGMTDLGEVSPAAINDTGQVVGYFNPHGGYFAHAFITGPNGVGMTDLGTLGGDSSVALGINATGEVVGYSTTATGSTHAFITGPNGVGMTDLDTSGRDDSKAYGINDSGQVVVGSGSLFITGPNGAGRTEIPIELGYYSNLNSYGINARGEVVGADNYDSYLPQFGIFITGPNGTGATFLTTENYPPFYYHATGVGINDAGQVVGHFITPDDGSIHAFVTGPDGVGVADLNWLVNVPYGFHLTGATAINNHGQILAVGEAGVIPEPQSYALMLAGLMIVGFIVRGKQKV